MRAAVPDVASHAPSARCLSARFMRLAALAAVTATVACATALVRTLDQPMRPFSGGGVTKLLRFSAHTTVDALGSVPPVGSMPSSLAM